MPPLLLHSVEAKKKTEFVAGGESCSLVWMLRIQNKIWSPFTAHWKSSLKVKCLINGGKNFNFINRKVRFGIGFLGAAQQKRAGEKFVNRTRAKKKQKRRCEQREKREPLSLSALINYWWYFTILLLISWKWISQTLSTTSSLWKVTKPKPATQHKRQFSIGTRQKWKSIDIDSGAAKCWKQI